MAIEDIVINFHGGTAASVSGKTINNFEGISAGEFSSDLLGYDTGGATGVSISAAKDLTAFANGRLDGVDTLTEQINQQSAYVNDSTAPSDNIYTATFPAGTTLLDVEIFLCVGSSNQNDLDGAANAETFTAFDSTNNTTGATVQLTGVVPDGSNQVVINIDNQHATNDFTAHNGIRFHNITHSDPSITITASRTEDEDAQAVTVNNVSPNINITVSQTEAGDIAASSTQVINQVSASRTEDSDTQSVSLVENIGFVNDDFAGTGTLGAHWSTLDESAGGVINVGRVSDYFEGTVDDNSSNRTRWYNTEEGRFDYQNVKVPASGTDKYIARNVGVGSVADPRSDLSYATNQFSFCGLMVKKGDDYMFMVFGHRGSSDQFTAENKSTISGVSDVNDEGPDVVGSGKTHGDAMIEVDSSGNVYFSHAELATDIWTLTNSGTGLVPSAFSLGSAGTDFQIGIIGYASDTIGVPFKYSVDSMELLSDAGIAVTQTEAEDLQTVSLSNIREVSAAQTEASDILSANVGNIVQVSASRTEQTDTQSVFVLTQETASIASSRTEAPDSQSLSVSNIVQIAASRTEAADTQTVDTTVTGETPVPVITLSGDDTVSHYQYSDYTDAGYTATDTEDGDITDDVVVGGSISTNVIGQYILVFNVSDSDSNAAVTKYRTINVIAPEVVVLTNTPTTRTLFARNGADTPVFTKDTSDVVDYLIDFSALLQSDTITSITITPTNATVDSSSFLGMKAQVWVSGGEAGVTGEVAVKIVTLAGRTIERSFKVSVGEY